MTDLLLLFKHLQPLVFDTLVSKPVVLEQATSRIVKVMSILLCTNQHPVCTDLYSSSPTICAW